MSFTSFWSNPKIDTSFVDALIKGNSDATRIAEKHMYTETPTPSSMRSQSGGGFSLRCDTCTPTPVSGSAPASGTVRAGGLFSPR